MAPREYADLYDPGRLRVPDNFMPVHPFDNGEMRIRDELLAPFPRRPEVILEHIAGYYAMISHLDAHIGRVLEALQRTGRADNTIIIFAGDNGLAVGQHGLMGKQNMYDHSIRVPLVVSGPGIGAGRRCDGLCYLHDVFPTLFDLLGLQAPAGVESRSLAPVLRGETDRTCETTFHAYMGVQRAVRDERFKLVEYYVNGTNTTQLFDLEEDPWEQRNLASGAAHAAEVRRLRSALLAWQQAVDDPMLSV